MPEREPGEDVRDDHRKQSRSAQRSLRAKNRELHRRAQKAEGALARNHNAEREEQRAIVGWLLDVRKRELSYVVEECECRDVAPWARSRMDADLSSEYHKEHGKAWASPERQKEAAERDAMMETIGKVGR